MFMLGGIFGCVTRTIETKISFPNLQESPYEREGLTLYEIYLGLRAHIDFHNSMHNDCLTYDYSFFIY